MKTGLHQRTRSHSKPSSATDSENASTTPAAASDLRCGHAGLPWVNVAMKNHPFQCQHKCSECAAEPFSVWHRVTETIHLIPHCHVSKCEVHTAVYIVQFLMACEMNTQTSVFMQQLFPPHHHLIARSNDMKHACGHAPSCTLIGMNVLSVGVELYTSSTPVPSLKLSLLPGICSPKLLVNYFTPFEEC
jgi:hypothetical protein